MAAYVDLRPGTRVNVIPPGDALGAAFEAVVRSVSENAIRVSMPKRNAETLRVEPGTAITLFTSLHGQVYQFATTVRLLETVPLEGLILDPPREAVRHDRRGYYRLVTRIEPRYVTTMTHDQPETVLRENVILDLSGGGLQMQTLGPVEAGHRLHLVFALEGDPLEVEAFADVLSARQPERGRRHVTVHGKFIDMPRAEAERIVRYVYRQQVELRKKGVL